MFGRRKDTLPHGDYLESLAVWQIQNGLNSLDLTPEQTERFRAFEKSGGDVRVANGLIYGRRLYRSGRVGRDDR